jgi:selenocysteine lyase/cysteine desulfurase
MTRVKMTPAELKGLLPTLKHYTWLNAAASSPLPQPVYEAMERHLAQARDSGDLQYPAWARFKESVRARMAAFVGATPQEVAFTPSTSFGFHVVARMLEARGVREVLTLETEFPSTTLPLLYGDLVLRGVRPRPDGSYPLSDLERALTPETGAVAVSVVQYASGYRVDLEGLAQLCRERGLALCLNAAQALGQVPLDFSALGATFLAATSHKWFMGGYGSGLLVIKKDWLESTPLPMAGWLSVQPNEQFQPFIHAEREDDEDGFTAWGTRIRREASALELGAGGFAGLHGVNAALALHEAVGGTTTLAHNVSLQLELRRRLRERGFVPNTPDVPQTLSGICVVKVRGEAGEVVRALAREERVVTTARGGGLRISTHVYNTLEDVERLLAALDTLGVKPG